MESIKKQIVRQKLTIMKHYCPYCNSEQEYYIDKRIFKEYKGVEVNVEENVPICKKCKNELIINNIEDENLKRIYNKYREIKNIITPSEIKDLREKYGISQRELTAILGFGKMTINRYEKGSLPSKSHSDYLRLILKEENKFFYKVEEAYYNNRISQKTYSKVKNNINKQDIYNNNYGLKIYIENELKIPPNIFNGFKVLDLEKLQNLISYIASKTKLYLTSLNKYLWFIDIISYNERAVAITGLTYIHEQYGPVILNRKYEEISKLNGKYKREDKENNDGSIQSVITSNGNYDLSDFNDKEIKIIDYVINLLSNKSVKEISNLSHKEFGWKNTKRFEKISFEYANNLEILKNEA